MASEPSGPGGHLETSLSTRLGGLASPSVVSMGEAFGGAGCGLDPKTIALVRLAALVAVGSAPAYFRRLVGDATSTGATAGDVIGTMTAVASIVGLARLVSAAPKLGLALGYDIDAALERLDPPWRSPTEPGPTS